MTRIVFLTITIFAGLVTLAQAQASEPMTIYGYQPPVPAELGTASAWSIFADGVIDQGASDRLSNFLTDNQVPGDSSLYLNSDGGNLTEGMKLGRIIRKHGLFTYIGRSDPTLSNIKPGECYSACALAFIGGVFRFGRTGSSYGVHRFYSPPGGEPINSDTAQIISAAVIGYIQEMGVNPSLFDFMTQAGSDEIKLLSDQEQIHLNVINNGEGPTDWTVESRDGRLYLQGKRQTWSGANIFVIACIVKKQLGLMVSFNSYKRGYEVRKTTHVHWLVIDGEYLTPTIIPITKLQVGKIETDDDTIVAKYILTNDIISQIMTAKTLGIALKASDDSRVFSGFYGLKFADGSKKLPGLLNTCRN